MSTKINVTRTFTSVLFKQNKRGGKAGRKEGKRCKEGKREKFSNIQQ